MLREYQVDAVSALRAKILAGMHRLLLVVPTGGGKTVIATEGMIAPAVARGRRVLFLAHRTELITQAHGKMPGRAGIIKAGFKPTPDAPIQVASVQTLTRRAAKPLADLVITDECHHANAATYRRIYDLYPDATHIGLSATPYTAQGRGLGTDFWQAIVSVTDVPTLTAAGHLVPVRTYAPTRVALDGIPTAQGDYATGPLAERCSALVGDLVKHYSRLAAGRRAICFAVNVEHSQSIAASFNAAGIPAEHIDGATDPVIRAEAIARLASGAIAVLCNCAILTEGTDIPPVSCIILARPTKSRVLWRQCVGRGMRPYPGKESCLLLDHANCSEMHGLISDVESHTLNDDQRVRAGDDSGPPVKTCPSCFAVILSACQVCPECGEAQPAAKSMKIETADGELLELAESKIHRVRFGMMQQEALEQWASTAKSKGYAPGWIGHQFQKRFGRWPCGQKQLAALLQGGVDD